MKSNSVRPQRGRDAKKKKEMLSNKEVCTMAVAVSRISNVVPAQSNTE